jgi:hypothetical protein
MASKAKTRFGRERRANDAAIRRSSGYACCQNMQEKGLSTVYRAMTGGLTPLSLRGGEAKGPESRSSEFAGRVPMRPLCVPTPFRPHQMDPTVGVSLASPK